MATLLLIIFWCCVGLIILNAAAIANVCGIKSFFITSIVMAFICMIFVIVAIYQPTAMDVYQGKTELEYTIKGDEVTDSTVVFKSDDEKPTQPIEMTDESINTDKSVLTRGDSILAMAMALTLQETKCHNIASKNGQFCGYLQMSEILVREANKILGKNMFTYNDRYDWNSCVAMFTILMEDKNPDLDLDRTIEIWNKYCPNAYKNQVKIYYEFLLMIFSNLTDE